MTGARRAPRLAAALGAAAVIAGAPGPRGLALPGVGAAHAQSDRYRPEPEDYDHEAERRSKFWDRAVSPDSEQYGNLVERAVAALAGSDAQNERDAEELLADAAKLDPAQPLAHWHLSRLYRRQERWQACAEALSRIARADPEWTPPGGAALGSSTLSYELGVCAARGGDFERAIAEYKRILRQGVTQIHVVHWQLGEAYMALGRLDEAIGSLSTADKLGGPRQAGVRYALAMAYDRDEQESRARAAMLEALAGDRNLSQLEAPSLPFAPAADQFYALGLANAALGNPDWAIAYFRHYLHVAADAPWAQRARDHLARLGREPVGKSFSIDGTARAADGLTDALRRAAAEAQRCTRDTPGLLVEVRVTLIASRTRARGRDPGGPGGAPGSSGNVPVAGVKARVAYSSGTKADEVKGVLACVESAAEAIAFPDPVGRRGQFLTARLYVIAR